MTTNPSTTWADIA